MGDITYNVKNLKGKYFTSIKYDGAHWQQVIKEIDIRIREDKEGFLQANIFVRGHNTYFYNIKDIKIIK